MRCLVTGAAGFIGSHLCERLLADGHEVVGIDAFIPYYPRPLKEANLAVSREHKAFTFHEVDLRSDSLAAATEGVEVVFHLAAMAGLRKSWTDFDLYQSCNLTATQRLIEAVRTSESLTRFVYASTSSVYGKFSSGNESLPTRPTSPYGVTKLASENLCVAFAEEFKLPLVILRYFSVYGPRQRPDMGYWKFINAILNDEEITVFGDGLQARGNTYVSDCVDATIAAVECIVGEAYNLGGGETANVWDIIRKIEGLLGKKANIKQGPARPGDQRYTCADTSKLQRHVGWVPKTTFDEGLMKQVEWQRTG